MSIGVEDKSSAGLSVQEEAIVEMVRYNKATPRLGVLREFTLGRTKMVYTRRSSQNLWGRFGGGWNWKLGVMIGGSTVLLDLLVASVRISRVKAAP